MVVKDITNQCISGKASTISGGTVPTVYLSRVPGERSITDHKRRSRHMLKQTPQHREIELAAKYRSSNRRIRRTT
jgi:hypothetical protein